MQPPLLFSDPDGACELRIGEAEGPARGVFDEMLGEAAGEVVFAGCDQLAQFVVVGEGGAIVKLAGRVDLLRRLLPPEFYAVPPFARSVEILQAEADGVDLAVAAGALRFFLMGGKAFADGEGFVGQAGELRDIRRRGWRGIVQEMAQVAVTAGGNSSEP